MEWMDWGRSALQERWPELIAAILFTGLGRWLARFSAKRRLRSRIAYELVETQRAIIDRAAPARWAQDAPREEWMLEPYVRRLDFLKGHAVQEGLGEKIEYAMHGYLRAVSDFIAIWAVARRRAGTFQQAYDTSVEALEEALDTLHHRRRYKPQIEDLKRQRPETGDAPPPSSSTRTALLDALDARPADV